MKSYLLKKVDSEYSNINFLDEGKKYVFSPRIRNINVSRISVFDQELIENILTNKFNKNFRTILNSAITSINEEDDSSTDGIMHILDEIARLKSIVAYKYQEYLSKEKEEKFNKQLQLLEVELQKELMEINMNNMVNRMNYYETLEENKGYSR